MLLIIPISTDGEREASELSVTFPASHSYQVCMGSPQQGLFHQMEWRKQLQSQFKGSALPVWARTRTCHV